MNETFEMEEAKRHNNDISGESKRTSNLNVWMILLKTHVGISITAMPFAIQEAGIFISLFLFLTLSPLLYRLNREVAIILVENGNPEFTIYDCISQLLGETHLKIFKFFLSICQIGICASYASFITLFLQKSILLMGVHGAKPFILLAMLLVLGPVCLIRVYKKFGGPSTLANGILIIVHGTVFVYCLQHILMNGTTMRLNDELKKSKNFLSIFGIILLGYNAMANLSYSYSTLRKPSDILPIYKSVFLTVASIYIAIGLISAIALGSQIKPIILFTFLEISTIFDFLLILYALVLTISFPVQLFPALESLESLVGIDTRRLPQSSSLISLIKHFLFLNWIRLLIVLLLFLFCILTPNLARCIDIIGSLTCSIIQFYYPISLFNAYYKNLSSRRILFNNIGMALLMFCGVCSVSYSIYRMAIS